MTSFYTTLAVCGSVAVSRLREGSFPSLPFAYFVAVPEEGNFVVLFLEAIPDVPNVGDYAAALISSALTEMPVVLAVVNREDTLRLRFFRDGQPVDEYCTEPGLLIGEELPPSGGNARRLAELFALSDADQIAELQDVLSAPRLDERYGFGKAKERHGEIAQLLGLPSASVGVGYESIQHGLIPDNVGPDVLRTVLPDEVFAKSGAMLRQYMIFCPTVGESGAQVAARFLPDVISWEDDFSGEGLPVLGSVADVGNHFADVFPELPQTRNQHWIVIDDGQFGQVTLDLGNAPTESAVEFVLLFSQSRDVPVSFFARLCARTNWAVWGYESRQVMYSPAAQPTLPIN